MEERYTPQNFEKKWQAAWQEAGLHTVADTVPGKENYYQLVEFSYPSGNLHVGHWYAFAVPDIHARFQRMKGKNVLYPMGFDAFGLPAENAAIKNNKDPKSWTTQNIAHMRGQLESMGAIFDWSRAVTTCDPGYYKWTQWLFIQLFNAGLVEQKETLANWCPKDKTVLANEQVVNNTCERCGTEIEKKKMKQWQLGITKYADRLLDDLENLDWPEEIKTSQKNWIGRSEGAEISFPLKFKNEVELKPNYLLLHGYTGRADKNFIPWLKTELEDRGFEVQAPQLPNTDNPAEEEQVGYVLENCKINESTIIVGHSLGGVVAMKVLEKLNTPIAGFVLVAPAMEPSFGSEARSYWETFNWEYDYKKIEALTNFRIILSDILEKKHRGAYLEYLAQKINAPVKEITAKKEHFTAKEEPFILNNLIPHIPVFTTRPDTLFGATYLVLAPEHLWVTLALRDDHRVLGNKEEVRAYVEASKKKTEIERANTTREKTGVRIEGVVAINPGSGEEIPIFIADYVLAGYGTGAIMAVPAHDERDFEFAKKFDLPIRQVVATHYIRRDDTEYVRQGVYGLISDGEKYLIQHFTKVDFYWLPGGGLDEGESEHEGLLRELNEETSYTEFSIQQKLLIGYVDTFSTSVGDLIRNQSNVFSVELKSQKQSTTSLTEAEILDEIELLWLTKEQIQGLQSKFEPERITLILDAISAHEGMVKTDEGVLVNSGQFDGLSSEEAKQKITESVGGKLTKTYRLRDWGVSRQRYWGCPIPLIHCDQCGWLPVPDAELPVELPPVEDYLPNDDGRSPLSKNLDFVNTTCPQCSGSAKRETDTLDVFVDSSWYFLRYCDPTNENIFAEKEKLAKWLPVDLYSGGAEHTTVHLLYSRFFHKALFDLGLVNESEPYTKRLNRSLILGPDGQKMSKSKGNVIDPDAIVAELGADTMRMYLAFIGPYNEVNSYPWNPEAVIGVHRFLERVWKLTSKVSADVNPDAQKIESILHMYLSATEESLASFKMNTGVAALMKCSNELKTFAALSPEHIHFYAQMLAPYAPHIAEELWNMFEGEGSVHESTWPIFDAGKVITQALKIAVQVNGKMRGVIEVTENMTEKGIQELALAHEKVQTALAGKEPKKIIVIPQKIVSIVL